MGVLRFPKRTLITKWRLQPGKMLLIDLEKGIISDEDLKTDASPKYPYQRMARATQMLFKDCRCPSRAPRNIRYCPARRQQAFGYTQEDLKFLLRRWPRPARKPSARWAPTRRSRRCRPGQAAASYFKQLFAQVTNPPIDPIREELGDVTGVVYRPASKPARPERTSRQKRLEVPQPILTNEDLEKIRVIGDIKRQPLPDHYPRHHLCSRQWRGRYGRGTGSSVRARESSVHEGHNIIILSDRMASPTRSPFRHCWRRRPCTTT